MTDTTLIQDTRIEQQSEAAKAAFHDDTPLLVHSEFKVMDLEKFQLMRRNYRVAFRTKSLAAWAAYCKAEIKGLTAPQVALAFVDSDNSTAKAIFDLGTPDRPGHGEWSANLALEKTPEYSALISISDQRLNQRKLCEWVEEWSSSLSFLDKDGADFDAKKALNALRTITVKAKRDSESKVDNFSGSRSTMESVEAAGRDAPLPAFVVMSAQPHSEFQQRDFVCRISLITGDEPQFVIWPQRLDKLREAIADEFVEKIRDETGGTDLRIEIGTVDY